jgi:transposase
MYIYKGYQVLDPPKSTMHSLSKAELENVLSLIDSGHSSRHIASITGLHYSTITRYWSKHRPNVPKPTGGRPLKLSATDMRRAVRLISSGKAENATQVTQSLQSITNQSLSQQTVRNHLKKAGLKAVVKKKRPLLAARHRRARMDFAASHKDWTVEDWKRVVWSDEVKFNRLTSDGRKWVYKRAGEALSDRMVEGSLKFGGGSLMMWGCMTWEGPGYACKIDGRMDADLYCQILEEELQETLHYYGKAADGIIFQQDNDPKHTSKKAQTWFKDHGFDVMKWPAQSPDLNPIEHLWHHIKKKLGGYEEAPKGIHELWERVEAEWEKIAPEVCQNLIESMPRRVQAVYKAKGGYTKY